MSDNNNKLIRSYQTKKFLSLSLDRDELKNLLDRLQLRADSSCDIEVRKIEAGTMNEQEKINAVANLRTCAIMKITVRGKSGEDFFGTIEDIFSSPVFPEHVTEVIVNSELLYKSNFKHYIDNSFTLYLNFKKHKVFDFSFQPSESTPNPSEFNVEGFDNTWVTGVFNEVVNKLAEKPGKFPFIHKGGVYDLFVWLIGLPFAFGLCYKITPLANQIFKTHSFLQNILYTYCFFFSLIFFRIFFHYVRWVYPMIEYREKNDKSIKHQVVIGILGLGILTNFIYDIIKVIFH